VISREIGTCISNGLSFLPSDFVLKSHTLARYGAGVIPDYMTIEDWGVTYDELEPFFDRFDKLCGTSGKAGNLRATLVPGGNPFEGVRSNEYPNKPLKQGHAGELFEKAANELGYHPFPLPASNASAPYVNSEGIQIGACQYCGFCTRFGCEANAKASANVCLQLMLLAGIGEPYDPASGKGAVGRNYCYHGSVGSLNSCALQ